MGHCRKDWRDEHPCLRDQCIVPVRFRPRLSLNFHSASSTILVVIKSPVTVFFVVSTGTMTGYMLGLWVTSWMCVAFRNVGSFEAWKLAPIRALPWYTLLWCNGYLRVRTRDCRRVVSGRNVMVVPLACRIKG